MDHLWDWTMGLGSGLILMSWIPESIQPKIALLVATLLIVAITIKWSYEFGKSRKK